MPGPSRSREFRHAVDLAPTGELRDEDGVRLDVPPEWTPEHLLLAALIHCSLKSLAFHAARAEMTIRDASGSARTLITRRETDGRYAIAEADVELAVEIDPEPGPDEIAELLALAERDCFVGASLSVKPRYRWTANGRTIGA
jgi:organic hydroperoxide reductase OsmC/OhrA